MFDIKIIDITRELNEDIIIYEGDPRIRIKQWATVEDNGFAVTEISFGSHSGTHIDAPSHVAAGARNVSEVPLSALMGECVVVDVDDIRVPAGCRNVIIKTWGKDKLRLAEKQARQLINAGVKLIGTDALSVGSDKVHQVLLGEGCMLLESLDLSKADCGTYFLCALPMKLKTDGAPVRACLIKNMGE